MRLTPLGTHRSAVNRPSMINDARCNFRDFYSPGSHLSSFARWRHSTASVSLPAPLRNPPVLFSVEVGHGGSTVATFIYA